MRAFLLSLCFLTLASAQSLPWATSVDAAHRGRVETAVLRSPEWGETTVRVCLPKTYGDSPGVVYPVLYVLDGQNVFQKGVYGDWTFDETVDEMIGSGQLAPLIVVSIDHPRARSDGYTSRRIWMPRAGEVPAHEEGGRADDYLEYLGRVRQTVAERYRCASGQDGLLGSSLGGVFALHAAFSSGSTFTRVAALSPSLWWFGEPGVGELFPRRPESGPTRVWLDMGERETRPPFDQVYVESAQLTAEWLASCLGDAADVHFESFPGATHNEAAWSRRLPEVLKFLYP